MPHNAAQRRTVPQRRTFWLLFKLLTPTLCSISVYLAPALHDLRSSAKLLLSLLFYHNFIFFETNSHIWRRSIVCSSLYKLFEQFYYPTRMLLVITNVNSLDLSVESKIV